jgi:hypothetical protein
MLRHSDITITARHYIEGKRRPSLDHLLKSERIIIPTEKAQGDPKQSLMGSRNDHIRDRATSGESERGGRSCSERSTDCGDRRHRQPD